MAKRFVNSCELCKSRDISDVTKCGPSRTGIFVTGVAIPSTVFSCRRGYRHASPAQKKAPHRHRPNSARSRAKACPVTALAVPKKSTHRLTRNCDRGPKVSDAKINSPYADPAFRAPSSPKRLCTESAASPSIAPHMEVGLQTKAQTQAAFRFSTIPFRCPPTGRVSPLRSLFVLLLGQGKICAVFPSTLLLQPC